MGCPLLLLFFFLSYSCTDTETQIIENSLVVDVDNVTFGSGASTQELNIESDILDELAVLVSENDIWCTTSIEGNILKVSVTDNPLKKSRMTVVTLSAKNRKQDILVTQGAYGFAKDKDVKAERVTATSFAEGFEPEKMLDGDPATYFNSKFGAITEWPFYLDFYFKGVDRIDYLVHTPRQDSGNKWGAIGQLEVWVATEENPTLAKYGDYDFRQALLVSSTIEFTGGLIKPKQIQFRIKSGYENRVSCALMQFFIRNATEPYDYLKVFTDGSCSEIKEGVTESDLNKIPDLFYKNIALAIFNNTYADKKDRIQDYRPYQHPDVMAATNKTSKYSLKDNATGMYIAAPGEELIVFAGNLKGQSPALNIRDYQTNREETYALKEGLNIFYPSIPGLIYIYNHTQDAIPLQLSTDAGKNAAAAKTIRVHIATGAVNGYFDIQKHTAEDWTGILANAKHTEIDILGIHSHVVWRTSDYRDNKTDIVLMTNYIDAVVDQQKEFQGLYYHNKSFNNRAFIHIDYSAPAAYATDYRTAYSLGYINVFCTEAGFRSRLWVLGHEVGHVNQVRPGVKWGGTTETTNNLYAIYNQQQILGEANRLTTGANGDNSNNYDVAFDLIIKGQRPWVLPGEYYDRYIAKLAPFWQLKLYFVDILKQEHFYHNLFEHYRTTPDLSSSELGDSYHGMLQLDFVRQVCNTGKMNMVEFFEDWGFLRTVDAVVNDYGNKTIKITREQIDALKDEINKKNYPKPAIRVQDLTDTNYRQYIQ
jgi:hypothetical protein